MKIRKIVLKNFGSHKSTEIDFSSLNSSPIIIITGDTGSGKSTILDGITFSLYQRVFRYSDKELKNIVGYYSNEIDETYTQLNFEINNEEYTIKRSITSGYSLEFSKGERKVPGSKSELDKKILDLLKVDYELFVRSIVLPQGQFSALLKTDDPSERRELFTKVFWDLVIYNGVKEKISEIVRELQKQKEELDRILSSYAKSIIDQINKLKLNIEDLEVSESFNLSHLGEKLTKLENIDLEDVVSYRNMVINQLNEILKNFENEKSEKQKIVEKVQGEISSLKNIKELTDKLKESYEELVKLSEKVFYNGFLDLSDLDFRVISDEATINEDFRVIASVKERFLNIKSKLENRLNEIRKVYSDYIQKEQKFETLEKSYNSIINQLRNKGKEVRGEEFEDTDDLQLYVGALSKEIDELSASLDKLELEIENKKRELEKLKEYDIDSEFKKIVGAEQLFLQIDNSRKEIDDFTDKVSDLEKEIYQIEVEIDKTRKEKSKLEECRISNVISYLKVRWNKGEYEFCPVCGSKLEGNIESKVGERKNVDMIMGFEEFEIKVREVENKLISLEKKKSEKVSELSLVKERIKKLEDDINEKSKELSNLGINSKEVLEKIRKKLQDKKNLIKSLEDTLRELDDSLKVKQKEKNNKENICNTLKQLFESIQETKRNIILPYKEELERFKDEFKSLVKDFFEVDDYKRITDFFKSGIKSKLEGSIVSLEQEIKKLDQSINDLNTFESMCKSYLSYKKSLEGIDISNLKELIIDKEEEYKKLVEEVKNIDSEIGQINNKIGMARAIFDTIEDSVKKYKDTFVEKINKDKEYDVIYSLSSKFDVNFINFVIKLKVLDICDKANQYLDMLGVSDKRLGISFDSNNSLRFEVDYNGQRSNVVNSLSGGESFLFSISLALAVSREVVSSSDFKSIFIDEGFDTLDEGFNVRLFSFLEQFANDNGVNIYVITHKQEISENTNYPKIVVSKEGSFSKVTISHL